MTPKFEVVVVKLSEIKFWRPWQGVIVRRQGALVFYIYGMAHWGSMHFFLKRIFLRLIRNIVLQLHKLKCWAASGFNFLAFLMGIFQRTL